MAAGRAAGQHRESGDIVPTAAVQRRFVETLHELSAVVWEMDARTWRFTFVGDRAEQMFGYPLQRWYEEATFWQDQLLHPNDRAWCVNFCSAASRECRDHAFLYRARNADGRALWIKDVVRIIPDETGAPTKLRGIMLDVTEEIEVQAPGHGQELDYDAPELLRLREVLAA